MTTTTDTVDQRPRVRRPRPDPEVWEDPPMRQALTAQDITTVYRLLNRLGFSQQHIAALTGQSQPEVSSIIHGRKVIAYDVLSRIADGLGIPRGYLGLSWCTCHAAVVPPKTDLSPKTDLPAENGRGRPQRTTVPSSRDEAMSDEQPVTEVTRG